MKFSICLCRFFLLFLFLKTVNQGKTTIHMQSIVISESYTTFFKVLNNISNLSANQFDNLKIGNIYGHLGCVRIV